MNHKWHQSLGYCLLSLTLMNGNSVDAQEVETTTIDTVSPKTMIEESSKNNETKTDTVKSDETKAVVIEEVVKDAEQEEKKTAILRVNVMQFGGDNLPIKDARVIVTYDNAKVFERKTDEAGVALLDDLPYGRVDVDVTSSGRRSGGGALVLEKPEETLTFHLEPRSLAE